MIEDAKTILDAGQKLAGVTNIPITGNTAPVLLDSDGQPRVLNFKEVQDWMAKPVRKRGNFAMSDADSFIRFFNRHKTADSIVCSNITDTAALFMGVLNANTPTGPDWEDFTVCFALQPTKEWQTWTSRNGKAMSQTEFALFLEDNADMFKQPSGADLLELVQTLEGKCEAGIKSAVRLPNGQLNVTITENISLRGGGTSSQEATIEMPAVLKVSLQPFHGTGIYDLSARLRYRIADRKITFWYETINAHLVLRQVASDVLLQIEKSTGVQPFKV